MGQWLQQGNGYSLQQQHLLFSFSFSAGTSHTSFPILHSFSPFLLFSFPEQSLESGLGRHDTHVAWCATRVRGKYEGGQLYNSICPLLLFLKYLIHSTLSEYKWDSLCSNGPANRGEKVGKAGRILLMQSHEGRRDY